MKLQIIKGGCEEPQSPLEILAESELRIYGHGEINIIDIGPKEYTYWVIPTEEEQYIQIGINILEKNWLGKKRYRVRKVDAQHGYSSIVVEDDERKEAVFFVVYRKSFYDQEIEKITKERFPELKEFTIKLTT